MEEVSACIGAIHRAQKRTKGCKEFPLYLLYILFLYILYIVYVICLGKLLYKLGERPFGAETRLIKIGTLLYYTPTPLFSKIRLFCTVQIQTFVFA